MTGLPSRAAVLDAARDRAAAAGVSFDTIVAPLLHDDVEAGVLDQHFPKKGAKS